MTDRGMILLNHLGDLEITWDPSEDSKMFDLIKKKMDQGYQFFVVKKGLFTTTEKEITTPFEIGEGRSVLVKDPDLDSLFASNTIRVKKSSNVTEIDTSRRAKTPEEAVKNTTVAVKPVRGG